MNHSSKIKYPLTKRGKHVDHYFGTNIADPYRWLEDDTTDEVKDWVNLQNKTTENFLLRIPFRRAVLKRLEQLMNFDRYTVPLQSGNWLAFLKSEGLENQPALYVQKGLKGISKKLLDTNNITQDGTRSIGEFSFSKEQKYFAYCLADAGSDWQCIEIMDFEQSTLLQEKIENVKFSHICWKGDDGFYYSGFERPKEERLKYLHPTTSQKVFYHQMGTNPDKDQVIYEDTEHPLRYVDCQLTEDGRFLILNISEGTDGVEIKVKDLQNAASRWITVVKGFSSNAQIIDNIQDDLLLYTNEQAPNFKLVRINLNSTGIIGRETIIPEKSVKLENVTAGGGYLFAHYLKNVCSEVIQMNTEGSKQRVIKLPGNGTVLGFEGSRNAQMLFYSFTSYVQPLNIFRFDCKTGQSVVYFDQHFPFDLKDYETRQIFYESQDGTAIPMSITCKKGTKLNDQNPALLYAYGGFNISLTPAFSPMNLLFLESGGIYCVANIRGGGEYGENWHHAGMLDKKQNVFDDFIAAAKYLFRNHYTCPKKLAIRGRSNGGLLIGASITQHPELFAVAVPQVGVMDMLRFHQFTVGWGWVPEYGSSDKQEQFNYLIRYSPLHNISEGVSYPATFVTTGDHDDRVVPAHSFKFAATLQKKQSGENPVFIRIDHDAGHGLGKPLTKLIHEEADIWSFVFYHLKMKPKDS